MITLQLKKVPEVPLEAETITPDAFFSKSAGEISALPILVGNQTAVLGDYFAVQGEANGEILVEGDLRRVKLLGAGMSQGSLTIHGDAGMHLGAGMRGGRITVHGNASDWAGAEMHGGQIHIHGSAGHGLGAGYRGSPKGMNRGLIVVDGDAGNEVGAAMRRGAIVVRGNTGLYTGSFMIAGTIVVMGHLGERPGAGLKRGTIVTWYQPHLLPSYRYACTYEPAFIDLLLAYLQSQGVPDLAGWLGGRYRRYSGDLVALGKGEILVREGA